MCVCVCVVCVCVCVCVRVCVYSINNLLILQTMLNAILTRLHKAVDDAYVPLFSKL